VGEDREKGPLMNVNQRQSRPLGINLEDARAKIEKKGRQ
jgi:hypothetical protein